ncbi:hypothetical protein THICB2_590110 [Thiomonas sp. CB2]|nr:hypothetical protein THICB2_590110 [Thiomonas sp. CB2]VDY03951.1 protein of unknown function [Thiomonas sp. Bio17B3]VDY08878.1 protein of unknown function [Thiomonas sp. Sup16B3]VDY12198.1 conserved protein of unknown function [Thiomonas sp. OC7]VDY18588.1 Hypothetical protein CB2_100366 [Thiomonas sp. CB2]
MQWRMGGLCMGAWLCAEGQFIFKPNAVPTRCRHRTEALNALMALGLLHFCAPPKTIRWCGSGTRKSHATH